MCVLYGRIRYRSILVNLWPQRARISGCPNTMSRQLFSLTQFFFFNDACRILSRDQISCTSKTDSRLAHAQAHARCYDLVVS